MECRRRCSSAWLSVGSRCRRQGDEPCCACGCRMEDAYRCRPSGLCPKPALGRAESGHSHSAGGRRQEAGNVRLLAGASRLTHLSLLRSCLCASALLDWSTLPVALQGLPVYATLLAKCGNDACKAGGRIEGNLMAVLCSRAQLVEHIWLLRTLRSTAVKPLL